MPRRAYLKLWRTKPAADLQREIALQDEIIAFLGERLAARDEDERRLIDALLRSERSNEAALALASRSVDRFEPNPDIVMTLVLVAALGHSDLACAMLAHALDQRASRFDGGTLRGSYRPERVAAAKREAARCRRERDCKKSAKKVRKEDNISGLAVIWGDPETATTAIIGEGIETLAGVAYAFTAEIAAGEIYVASCIDANGVRNFKPWPATRRVIVAADRDEAPGCNQQGEKAAHDFAGRHCDELVVSIALPGAAGEYIDYCDLLRRDGVEAVRNRILSAIPFTPAQIEAERRVSPTAARLPEIWPEHGLALSTQHAWNALVAINCPARLFRFGGACCRISRDEHGVTIIDMLDKPKMRYELARAAEWWETGQHGDVHKIAPPSVNVEDVLATPDPPLPVLTGIVNAPVFGPDGALESEPGYHASTGQFYVAEPGLSVAPVSEQPSLSEIAEARRLLLDETLGDFAFDGPSDGQCEKARAVALVLQPFARLLIDGATPIYLIDKPTPGSGAGLLVDVVSIISTGHPATVTTEARDDDEMRKKLTAALAAGKQVFFLDNVNRRLDSGALASAVTAKFWEDRVLGETRIVRVRVRCSWIVAGNNVQTSNEIARRCVRIRLDPKTDRPEERSDFRHPNLLGWVTENRDRLVWACLTLIRAWLAAGRKPHARTIGSFEAWCRVMGGILDAAEIPGFLGNLQDMRDKADEEGETLRMFIAAWYQEHKHAAVTVGQLLLVADKLQPGLPLGDGFENSRRIRLGKLLSRLRDRQFRIRHQDKGKEHQLELRVERGGVSHHAIEWRLKVIAGNVAPLRPRMDATPPDSIDEGRVRSADVEPSPQPSPAQSVGCAIEGEGGEDGEDAARSRACTGARAPARARITEPGNTLATLPTLPATEEFRGVDEGRVAGRIGQRADQLSPTPTRRPDSQLIDSTEVEPRQEALSRLQRGGDQGMPELPYEEHVI